MEIELHRQTKNAAEPLSDVISQLRAANNALQETVSTIEVIQTTLPTIDSTRQTQNQTHPATIPSNTPAQPKISNTPATYRDALIRPTNAMQEEPTNTNPDIPPQLEQQWIQARQILVDWSKRNTGNVEDLPPNLTEPMWVQKATEAIEYTWPNGFTEAEEENEVIEISQNDQTHTDRASGFDKL